MNRIFSILIALLAILLTLSLVSCGSASYEGETGAAAGGDYANGGTVEKSEIGGDLGMTADSTTATMPDEENRKIIKTYRLSAETQEFDAATERLNALIAECGGYIESSDVHGTALQSGSNARRSASYTLRIPAERAEGFVGSVGDLLNVTYSSSSVEDVSTQYYSIEARLEELRTERDSLLAMMGSLDTQADYNFWLTLQSRISSVKQEIASYESQLKNYDSRVSYSSVYLSLSEVKIYTTSEEDSFLTQLGNAFAEGWSAFTVFLSGLVLGIASTLPFLVILAAIITGIVLLIKHSRKKKKQKQLDAHQKIIDEAHEDE